MTKENYRNMMSEKLIVAFQQTFYEKVGYVPIVHTNREHRNNNKILKLEELESIINQFIPEELTKRHKIKSVKSSSRFRPLADIRHMFCHIAYSMGYKLTDIGRYLNNRDHTTVINSLKRFKELISYDELFLNNYEIVLQNINKHMDNGDKLLHFAFEESVDTESTLSSVLL
jgi:hypothetical protein